MHTDLKKKLNYEYEKYKMLTLASSRENIYAQAPQIEKRRNIIKFFRTKDLTLEEKNSLMNCENLLERICLNMEESGGTIDETISKLIESR